MAPIQTLQGRRPTTVVEKRDASVQIAEGVSAATHHIVRTLETIKADYGDVRGVRAFTDLVIAVYQPLEQPLDDVVAQARAMPVNSQASYKLASKALQTRMKELTARMERNFPTIPEDRDAAAVAANMRVTDCMFMR